MLENVAAGVIFIIWLPLTLLIFMKLKKGKTIVSYDGLNGFFSAYLGIFVLAGFIAILIILLPLMFLRSVFLFLYEHWKVTLLVIIGIGYLLNKNSENTQLETNNLHNTPLDTSVSEESANTTSMSETRKGASLEEKEIPLANMQRKSLLSNVTSAENNKTLVKYCGYCGAPMATEDLFCSNCGKPSN